MCSESLCMCCGQPTTQHALLLQLKSSPGYDHSNFVFAHNNIMRPLLRLRAFSCSQLFFSVILLISCISSINAVAPYAAPEECEWHSLASNSTSAYIHSTSGSYLAPLLYGDDDGTDLQAPAPLPPDAVALLCRLRCVNCAAHPPTNFSQVQRSRTASLHVQCDELLAMSSLANGSFAHLTALQQLRLHGCKLPQLLDSAFIGLTELRHLSVRTHNSDWQLQLQLPSDTLLSSTPALQSLDLSANALTRLPARLLCPATKLRAVNLSDNHIAELSALSFGGKNRACDLHALNSLDISANRLKVLTDHALAALSGLGSLNLHGNQISRAEESSLAGLRSLRLLRMSGNQLVALPPRFFRPVSDHLQELYLQNNSISVLPPGLFNEMRSLKRLDLSHNEITSHWIHARTFEHLTSLAWLDLSYNRLNRLDAATFSAQTSLSSLSLAYNELDAIAPDVFRSLTQLSFLSLAHNRLHSVPSDLFKPLNSLRMLHVDGNSLSQLPNILFTNLTELLELNVSSNALSSVPAALHSLSQLRSLDLSHNRITRLSNASLRGLEQLYSLSVEGNQLTNLSRGALAELPSLRILNLAANRLEHAAAGTFEDVPDLHLLRLDRNRLTDVNGLFSHLRDLLMLNISENRIAWFDYALIPIGLQLLDLRANRVASLGNFYQLEAVLKLRTLDASYNRISELNAASLPNGIELLHLQGNQLKSIAPFTFLGKHNLTKVDLSRNQLRHVPLNALQLSTARLRRPMPELRVSGNSFTCDCTMDWLQRAASLHETRQYPRLVDAAELQCTPAASNHSRPVSEVRADQYLCSYRTHCFALCHCCEFDACDCKMTCPDGCECYYDAGWTVNVVSCSGPRRRIDQWDVDQALDGEYNSLNNELMDAELSHPLGAGEVLPATTTLRPLHRTLPARIPMDATELRLDGNDIPALSAHAFIGRKSMRVLWLNSSNIAAIHNRTFNGLRSLQVLLLQRNVLTTLHGFEFEWLSELHSLDLGFNRLSSIANHTFAALRSLRQLNLAGNRLITFPLATLQVNTQLTRLRLAGNRWTCECDFTAGAVPFLRSLAGRLADGEHLRCRLNEQQTSLLLTEFRQSQCIARPPNSGRSSPVSSRAPSAFQRFPTAGYLPLAAALAAGSLLLATLAMLVALLVYRRECGLWCYSKYGVRWSGSPLSSGSTQTSTGRREEERLFDAYLSYSKKEESFVGQMLAPELEYGSPPFRLCLHYRDLPVASGYLSEAIAEAMQASRRTIMLISDAYLKNEWCRYEFKNAHLEVLRSNRQKLILVFLGSISLKELQGKKFEWVIYAD